MVLVSFENIHYLAKLWPKTTNMPIFGHVRILANRVKIFYVSSGFQETIIYWLVLRNPGYVAYFSFLIFWATFGRKMGVATTLTPSGLKPSNRTKKLAHWVDLSDQLLSRKHVFEIFRDEPPLNVSKNVIRKFYS